MQKFSKYSRVRSSKISRVRLDDVETNWTWGYLGPNDLWPSSNYQ